MLTTRQCASFVVLPGCAGTRNMPSSTGWPLTFRLAVAEDSSAEPFKPGLISTTREIATDGIRVHERIERLLIVAPRGIKQECERVGRFRFEALPPEIRAREEREHDDDDHADGHEPMYAAQTRAARATLRRRTARRLRRTPTTRRRL